MTDRLRGPLPWLIVAALLPLVLGPYHVALFGYIFIAALVTLGIVLLTGVTGLISFGQAAFVGIGAYTTAYLTTTLAMSPWLTLPVAVVLTAGAAAVIGAVTLRMSGHFLAIASLAWGISIYFLVGNLPYFGGFNGLSGIPALTLFGIDLRGETAMYYVILSFLAASIWAVLNLLDSRVGRAIRSIRHGAALAESVGADPARLKIAVFVIAAALAALAGWLYAHHQRFVNPTPFGIHMGIEYLFMAVIGGVSSVWGAVIGALVVTLMKQALEDLLPSLLGQSGNFEIVVFGVLMLLVLQHARQGLWPWLIERTGVRRAPSRVAADPMPAIRAKPEPGEAILRIDRVRKSFGGLAAVDELSFRAEAGRVLGLLGPNGAGKSTMFNLISGVLPVSSGEIRFLDRRIDRERSRVLAAQGMARTFQHVKLVPSMTVLENAALGAHLRGRHGLLRAALRLDRAEEARLLAEAAYQLERVGLFAQRDELAGNLPLGQQRILEIARALASDPVLLLLDEPAAGLRYKEKQALARLLMRLRDDGVTVLLVEHDMDFILGIADRLVVMHYGRKLADGAPREVQANADVQLAYLGAD
ncbi:branched-chain amino acid ABC transporter ATP-binding protein/permease [Azospirillum sp. RWY-5-1]|uniref:Branched-chain amino acid ABC transporter ATP-binding protein/permease n=1 Tax=Azospirillum oleiclasticum TaxID=2735135 RepID=A0ABX2TG15_9PROT|nr:branched-chain amino acid ABC transporter ATP-binding protein/permease [Azospirillum oleiclasticum]NYZ15813.1 branched-chain amino acid ABC transporter ATP-binding protein/permease [Azospirillum oleiclasticum]NYZ22083.1 branched-chain amino acid ABC transporter ATP-binding protein/permease [Azospirillum oleiclasticum]